MLDPAGEEKLKVLYPDLQVRVRRVYEDMWRIHGQRMKITEGIRSLQRQKELYAQGRTIPGRVVTNSRPGYSFHHYGLAFDSCFSGPDPYLEKSPLGAHMWAEFGKFSEAHGLTWGGNFKTVKDRPHCQMTYGLSIVECLDLFKTGGIQAVFAQIDSLRDES